MRKSTIMNRIRMAKQAGDEKEKAYWEGRLHEYKNDRKARRGGYQIYTVKEGDSYFSIAEDEYEDQLYAAEIAKANDGIFKLFKGMKIKLPPKKEDEKGPAFTYEDWGNVLLTNEEDIDNFKQAVDAHEKGNFQKQDELL